METPANSILWDDESVCKHYGREKPEEVIICDSGAMRVFDINKGKMTDCIKVVKNSGYENEELGRAKRVSLDQNLIGNTIGNHIVWWDTREYSGRPAYKIENAHLAPIWDIDFNPNKPYACWTGGEDLNIRFWDIRKGNNWVLSFEEDSHWVLNVKYNRYHDQLVLTSSSSTYASLWRAASWSSINTPLTKNTAGVQDSKEKNTIIQTYEHEDSIHAIEWSASDAWIFASISYNGTFYINTVPSEEKWIVLWD